jgi:hypothetical protein
MALSDIKKMNAFKMKIKQENIAEGGIYFMTGVSGWDIPKGVLVYNTTTNKLMFGNASGLRGLSGCDNLTSTNAATGS